MEQSIGKKIFHICMIIGIIAAILIAVWILTLVYQAEGETNLPFEISKIAVISSVNGKDNKDEANVWNITVNQNNDMYIYIDKNNDYSKTEVIDTVTIDNIAINKEVQKGETHVYKPAEQEGELFQNTEENIIQELTYIGDMESNIKNLKIANQGGLVVIRFANDNLANYLSGEGEQVDYSKLLQLTNISMEELKATASFDLSINLKSGKTFKATVTTDIPIEGVIENGTASKEIVDTKDIIFKRIENN